MSCAVSCLYAAAVTQFGQLAHSDGYARRQGKRNTFFLLTVARDMTVRIADQESDTASIGLFPTQSLSEIGMLQPDEIVGIAGKSDFVLRTMNQRAPQRLWRR